MSMKNESHITDREVRAVILAAGKGIRMKSNLPKVLHEINGRPLVKYITDACRGAGTNTIYIIVGTGADQVKQALGSDFTYVMQHKQSGTGHALKQVIPYLKNYRGELLVLVGDSPLLTSTLLKKLIAKHREYGAAATFITTEYDITPQYGRVIRDKIGRVQKIIEERDAPPHIRQLKEVITSHYCFTAEVVLPLLSKIGRNNAQQEYNLTEMIAILTNEQLPVETLFEKDNRLVFGINDHKDLEKAAIMKKQL